MPERTVPEPPGSAAGQEAAPPGPSRREALRLAALLGVSATAAAGALRGLVRATEIHRIAETRTRMGTLVTVTVVSGDAARARSAVRETFAEMERLERILSRHRADTPLARLNREGALADAPAELLEVLGRARDHSVRSGGAFDVTVGPLLALHEESFARDGAPPPAERVRAAARLVDYRALEVSGRGVRFGRPGMAVTLDGIAKGYIVDRAVEVLVRSGAERVLVDAGGDMASGGRAVGRRPWRIGIQDPHRRGGTVRSVLLAGTAVATSGDYAGAFTADRRHHRILDPRTGRSPGETSSSTVAARSAMDADALSTAVFVLGPAEGVRLLERSGAEGLVVSKTGERFATRAFGSGART